jgi:DNA sulfur modification protein DndD
MIILSAKFQNFRILRNISINFSDNGKKKLSVIRAENESGKTTMLRGLQWALFGDEALPKKGRQFRIHPIDWDGGEEVKIIVEIVFKHIWKNDLFNGKQIVEEKKYFLRRYAKEIIHDKNEFTRSKSELILMEIKHSGHEPVSNPEDRIKQILGSNLKDLFFTDGDDALRFIQGKSGDAAKKELVKNAIRDMLSFEILEEGIKHVKKGITDLRDQSRSLKGQDELKKISLALKECEDNITKSEELITEYDDQLSDADTAVKKAERQLEEALSKGNKDELTRQLKTHERTEENYKKNLADVRNSIGKECQSDLLCSLLLHDGMSSCYSYLNKLRDKGKIPKASLPYLKELLEREICLCGSELCDGSSEREEISKLIKDQETHSDLDDRITQLRIIADGKLSRYAPEKWISSITGLLKNLGSLKKQIEDTQGSIKRVNNQISAIPDFNIKELYNNKDICKEVRDRLLIKRNKADYYITEYKKDNQHLKKLYEIALRQSNKAKAFYYKTVAANDLLEIIQNVYQDIENNEIPKVSRKLNQYFLEMIKVDEDQGSLIKKAQINPNYLIQVTGSNEKELDPSVDLNGASRRALTIAFILALTNVSEFIAPNVIDTPLGMMDPMIKKAVLTVLHRESNQLILFLTRSEIRDIENELDEYAGLVTSMINTAHYPNKLVNNPPEQKFISTKTCNCTHREFCTLCEHIGDSDNPLLKYVN